MRRRRNATRIYGTEMPTVMYHCANETSIAEPDVMSVRARRQTPPNVRLSFVIVARVSFGDRTDEPTVPR